MQTNHSTNHSAARRARAQAFTLAEVVISVGLTAFVFAGILTGYIKSANRAEWSGYSLAAQALAIQQIEQGRSAIWDNSIGKNELTNLNLTGWTWTYNAGTGVGLGSGYTTAILDLPYSGTNIVRATNYVTLRMFYCNNSATPPVKLQMLQVDTVWPFARGAIIRYHTNSVATYFSPDNRDPSTL